LVEYRFSFGDSSKLNTSIEIEHIDPLVPVILQRFNGQDGISAIL